MAELQLTAEQRMVVEDRGGSLLVSAAAGSGKTKVLVDRLFRYLREDHANVDDFLIITYTKAAAAELRGKIATELSRQIALTPEDGHLRSQLLRVYQADIKTVDAFCAGLLRENTHLLAREEDRRSLSPDFRTLDEDEAALLRRRVLERTLDGFYGELSEAGTLLADTLGHGRDDQKLEDLVLELYGKIQSHAWPLVWLRENRAQWAAMTAEGDFDATPYAAILRGKIRRWAELWSRRLTDCAERMRSDEKLAAKHMPSFLDVAEQLARLAEREDWDSLSAGLAGIDFPKRGQVRNGGPEKERGDICWRTCSDEWKKLRKDMDISGREAMEDLAAMLPGMGGKKMDLSVDEGQLAKTEAIILSMTPYERENPAVLNSSRKKRIAAGSGTQVVDVNRLLKQFEMVQQLSRQFASPGKKKGLLGKLKGMGGGMGLPF